VIPPPLRQADIAYANAGRHFRVLLQNVRRRLIPKELGQPLGHECMTGASHLIKGELELPLHPVRIQMLFRMIRVCADICQHAEFVFFQSHKLNSAESRECLPIIFILANMISSSNELARLYYIKIGV
jgi:hypothetical protein